jgi:hypothetical protein
MSKKPATLEKKRFTYKAMRRAALVGAMHGYYFAYTEFGLKEGDDLDVAAATKMSLEKVLEDIAGIEGVGFTAPGIRIDVLKDIVRMADSDKADIAECVRGKRKQKAKKAFTLKVEELDKDEGITPAGMIAATKALWKRDNDKDRYNLVKHKKAISDVLRRSGSKRLIDK